MYVSHIQELKVLKFEISCINDISHFQNYGPDRTILPERCAQMMTYTIGFEMLKIHTKHLLFYSPSFSTDRSLENSNNISLMKYQTV